MDGAGVDKPAPSPIYQQAIREKDRVSSAFGISRYFVILAAVWMIAMTWRIYPQFKDTLRIDGRLVTLADYVDENCSQRVGPAAASCVEEARGAGRRLVAREQGKSVLFIEAPILGYLLIYLPLRLVADGVWHRRGRRAGAVREIAVK